ncbi:MAG: hydroxylamine oxidase [Ignavibacteria bacterium]|nr:hydroxylamine oxidase [Ignavibacteria bacterium]
MKYLYGLLIPMIVAGMWVGTTMKDRDPLRTPAISEQTQECLGCHENVSPGIVEDWRTSRHSTTSPAQGLQKAMLARRISNENIPANLKSVVVGCYECHSLNPAAHKDSFEHFGYPINVIVSPNDCATCHSVEAEQYAHSKKAHAVGNLEENPVYHTLVETITGVKEFHEGKMTHLKPSESTKNETCFACHGTRVEVKGMRTVETDLGPIEVPNLTNWPNQGVGRINPDGSRGSCTACHPRHSFSIEIARKPYTCSQCHLQPDVPAWDVYKESKHGNIFFSKYAEWNWSTVPWRVGVDFKAPTCATCHNSLLVNSAGEVVAERSHDFGSRLWVRIFGLIYTHPQPKSGATSIIKNKDGLPLPTTFKGEIAHQYLIDAQEQGRRKEGMMKVCRSCHSSSWTGGFFARFDTTLAETDRMIATTTKLMQRAWDNKLADPKNPFDEKIEQMWIANWLFYANSIRYAAAMSGPDYATFKNGWWDLTKNLQDMKEEIDGRMKRK